MSETCKYTRSTNVISSKGEVLYNQDFDCSNQWICADKDLAALILASAETKTDVVITSQKGECTKSK